MTGREKFAILSKLARERVRKEPERGSGPNLETIQKRETRKKRGAAEKRTGRGTREGEAEGKRETRRKTAKIPKSLVLREKGTERGTWTETLKD